MMTNDAPLFTGEHYALDAVREAMRATAAASYDVCPPLDDWAKVSFGHLVLVSWSEDDPLEAYYEVPTSVEVRGENKFSRFATTAQVKAVLDPTGKGWVVTIDPWNEEIEDLGLSCFTHRR
jgi:hypothetical protein